ncbi:zinc finger protein 184-like [Armigeres subalbatus]|uniref:zinc finger protein 184-like n=1 Tax=Armigeres subalbatus TaxID=124917 RepID=UPI002ED21593
MNATNFVTAELGATLDDFCRLCLRQYGAPWMHPWRERLPVGGTETTVSIPDMLVYCCGLPSNLTDELPQRVCIPCIKRLQQAFAICRDIKEKETILDRFLLNGSVLERLIKYEQFRFDKKDETPVEEINGIDEPLAEDIKLSETTLINVSNTFPLDEVDVSQSCVEELDNDQTQNPTSECFIRREENFTTTNLSNQCDSSREIASDCTQKIRTQARLQVKPKESLFQLKNKPLSKTKSLTANKCKRKAGRRSKLFEDVPSEPEEDGFFHCTLCPRKFPQRRNFREHWGVHLARKDQRYKCPECGKIFGKRDHLVRHVHKHRERT